MPLRYTAVRHGVRSLWLALLLVLATAAYAVAADADKKALAPEVERNLDALLGAVNRAGQLPAPAELAPLLDFAFRPASETAKLTPAKRDAGLGAYARDTIRAPLERIIRYCYDPEIPAEAIYPSSLRRGYWLKGSEITQQKVPLWERLRALDEPVVVRGAEYEEITPDTFSGCYYAYTLDRLLILTRHEGRALLISVSRQQGPSNVGHKAAIVGDDTNWEYVYTKTPGGTARSIGWMDTYMYDSATVTVFFEESPGSATTGYAMFKWLKAGWADLNVVQPAHILSGAARCLVTFKQLMESAKLPAAEDIVATRRALAAKTEQELRASLLGYSTQLAAIGQSDSILSRDEFWKLIKDGGYAQTLSQPEMLSTLMKNFIKQRIGKTVLGQ